jgi:tryptophanyl-tRNA synthetase
MTTAIPTATAAPKYNEKDGRKTVLSGIQATGSLHLGNFIGALSVWVKSQDQFDNHFFIANLHSLTIPEAVTPQYLYNKSREIVAIYLAAGLDPAKTTIFLQSDVYAHPYFGWILTCLTPIGWLERMTQFKSKSERAETISTGLLAYPTLQAADILLYKPAYVPVGEDQRQHLELTRDVAGRFNSLYGDYFPLPEPLIRASGARIMGLDTPEAKMSKSVAETSKNHAIRLLDDPKAITKAIMSAKTDTDSIVSFADGSPGVKNLLTIYETLTGESRAAIESRFAGQGYGVLKKAVAEAVVETLRPMQERYAQITAEPGYVESVLKDGAARASEVANRTLDDVRRLVGVN